MDPTDFFDSLDSIDPFDSKISFRKPYDRITDEPTDELTDEIEYVPSDSEISEEENLFRNITFNDTNYINDIIHKIHKIIGE